MPGPEIGGFYSQDSLVNLVSHLGDSRDKQSYSTFAVREMRTAIEYEIAYRTWLVSKVVDIIPNEACRRWRELRIENRDVDEYEEFSKSIGVKAAINETHKWGRLFGGGGAYMVFDDEVDTAQPLDLETVSPDNPLVRLVPFDRFDVETRINEDPGSPNYMRPETYRFLTSQKWIHWSRVLGPIDGYPYPNRMRKDNFGWGGSVVERTADIVLQATSTFASVATLMHKADVDAIGVAGLLTKTSDPTLTTQMITRFQLAQSLMSNNSFLLYDKDKEELHKSQAALSAPTGLIAEMISLVASATGIPITEFYGTAPKGLNATGEGDRKQFQAKIAGEQNQNYDPVFMRLDPVMSRSVWGTEEKIEYEWKPLEDPTELESAQAGNLRANTAQTYVTMGAIQPSHVAQELLSDGTYSALDKEYVDGLAEAEMMEPEEPELPEIPEEGEDADQRDQTAGENPEEPPTQRR